MSSTPTRPSALALGRLASGLPLVYTIHHAQEPVLSRYYAHFEGVDFVCISRDQCRRETGTAWCSVIHHGLDASRYQWSEQAEPYVCFVGRLAREKGPVTAIDAAARARVAIRMAGSIHPPDQAYVEDKVLRRMSGPGVTWMGPIGPDQKIPLLRDARALLAPIEWNEPFGLILIEALLVRVSGGRLRPRERARAGRARRHRLHRLARRATWSSSSGPAGRWTTSIGGGSGRSPSAASTDRGWWRTTSGLYQAAAERGRRPDLRPITAA